MFVLTISTPISTMGHVGSKSRSPGQILENYCLHFTCRGYICDPILIKLRMFVLTISMPSSNMCHVGSKTRSPGQILENYCVQSRGQICDPCVMNLCQNVYFINISAKFEICHDCSKTRSSGQILENSCLHSRGHICARF